MEEKHYDIEEDDAESDLNTPHLNFDNYLETTVEGQQVGHSRRSSLGASARSNFLDNPLPHEADEAAVERVLHTINNNSATHLVQSVGMLGTISEIDSHLHPIFEHEDEDIASEDENEHRYVQQHRQV